MGWRVRFEKRDGVIVTATRGDLKRASRRRSRVDSERHFDFFTSDKHKAMLRLKARDQHQGLSEFARGRELPRSVRHVLSRLVPGLFYLLSGPHDPGILLVEGCELLKRGGEVSASGQIERPGNTLLQRVG